MGVPYCSMTPSPAFWTSHSNSTPVASRTRRVASLTSGPTPSPGIKVTRCGAKTHPSYQRSVAILSYVAQVGLPSSPFETRAQSPLAQANYQLWIEHARAENRRELERLVATLHDDCEYEVVPLGQRWRGKDQVREFYRGLWRGIPNVKLKLLNRIDAEDCIVEESEVFGRMEGPLFGVEPSGNELRYRVVIFFPVRDRLFTGERVYFDVVEFARQVPAARVLLDGRQP